MEVTVKNHQFATYAVEPDGGYWKVVTRTAAIAEDGGACDAWTTVDEQWFRCRRVAKKAWKRILNGVNPAEVVDFRRD